MQLKKYVRPVLGGAAAVIGTLGFALIGLPLGLPFLLGYLLSLAAEPAVVLTEKESLSFSSEIICAKAVP